MASRGNRCSSGPLHPRTFPQYITLAMKMQLAMNIFNTTASGVIFSFKLICLSGGIMGLYFFMRLALVQPFFATLMFLMLLFNCNTFYSVMWSKVNVVPDTMDRILRGLTTRCPPADRKLAQRLLKLIPCVAVKVGNFRSMERNSTLIFLDFVVGTTSSCLVGF